MRIALYTPYLWVLGGGEKYFLSIAQRLACRGHEVDVFMEKLHGTPEETMAEISSALDLKLKGVRAIPLSFSRWAERFYKLGFYPLRFLDYDWIFYISNELPYFSFHPKSVVVIQFPFPSPLKKRAGLEVLRRKNLARHKKIFTYSQYSARWIKRFWDVEATVLYPPVKPIPENEKVEKEKIILSVGRFFEYDHNKKHLFMVRAFRKMVRQGLKNWKLVLAGRCLPPDRAYLEAVRAEVGGLPVEVLADLSTAEMTTTYQRAQIYWHAAGFGENPQTHPGRFEHFGISTVEAMSASCVPVVINEGGQKEIVEQGISGYLWTSEEELIRRSFELAEDSKKLAEMGQQAKKRSRFFDEKVFAQGFEAACNEIGLTS